MAVTYVGASHTPGRAGEYVNSTTINKPSGVQEDDLLLAIISVSLSSGTVTAPSGWTTVGNTTSGSYYRLYVFRKVAGSSEPSSYTFTLNGYYWGIEHIVAYRGVDTSNPVPEYNLRGVSGSTTSYNTNSLSVADTRHVVHFGNAYKVSTASPPTWTSGSGTERFEASVINDAEADWPMSTGLYDEEVAAGSHSFTHTTSSSQDNGIAGAIAINPLSEPASGPLELEAPAVVAEFDGERMIPAGPIAAEVPAATAEFTGEFLGDRLNAVSPTPSTEFEVRKIIDADVLAEAPTARTDLAGGNDLFGPLTAVAPTPQVLLGSETKVVGSRVIVVVAEDRTTYV